MEAYQQSLDNAMKALKQAEHYLTYPSNVELGEAWVKAATAWTRIAAVQREDI